MIQLPFHLIKVAINAKVIAYETLEQKSMLSLGKSNSLIPAGPHNPWKS